MTKTYLLRHCTGKFVLLGSKRHAKEDSCVMNGLAHLALRIHIFQPL